MSWSSVGAMVGLGFGAGVIGGMFGIGGGLIIVPALVLAVGLDQKMATGTSLLAQLLPVALFAVLEYWRRGEIDVPKGLGIAAGLLFGTLIGALLTGLIPPFAMKRAYGAFLVLVGLYFLSGWTPQSTAKPETSASATP